jgi:hypothetical protein
MKIDPGIHMVMHLVFFGKTGVTFLEAVEDGLGRHAVDLMPAEESARAVGPPALVTPERVKENARDGERWRADAETDAERQLVTVELRGLCHT